MGNLQGVSQINTQHKQTITHLLREIDWMNLAWLPKKDVFLSGVGGAEEKRCQIRVRGLTGSNEGPGQPLETPLAVSQ